MPFCPYTTLIRPVLSVTDSALQRVNAVNGSLKGYSNLLFGLFSLHLVLSLHSPAYEFGGPDKPVDTAKVGVGRDGVLQYNWFQWKPFLANLNLSVFYFLRIVYGIDWWTDLWALSLLSLEGADRLVAAFFGNLPRQMTILGGVSLNPFQLIPKDGNEFDKLRLRFTEWKYELGLWVRRVAVTNLVGQSLWQLYRRFLSRQP